MTSPYFTAGEAYRDQGLSVIPCMAGSKIPGRYTAADGWTAAYDWQKYCDRLPSSFETSIWDKWPSAGVCLALGRASAPVGLQLVAIDIDTEEAAEVAAIRGVLPGSPCAKAGAKGETQFYLASDAVVNRPYNDANKRRMLDLLAHGRQTVMPPTTHPDCPHCGSKGKVIDMHCTACGAEGRAYRWITPDTLEAYPISDLPMLPDDIGERLAEALAPFGYEAPTVREPGNAELGIDSPHRSLNDAALANLDAWIPNLGLHGCRRVGHKYKAVAHWRPSSSGRPLSQRATNLAISPEGIKDKGAEKGYTPLDLVMAACGADLDSAFRWLQERVAPAEPVRLTASAPVARAGNLAGLRLATFNGEPVQPPAAIPDEPESPLPATTSPIVPPEICTPPGLVGEIVEWMNGTAARPLPQLNLAATLTLLGTLAGRRYESPTLARTNLYCVGVAPTGRGKGHPLAALSRLSEHTGISAYLGPEGIKSESAIRKLLEAKPTVLCAIDEMGELMKKMLSKKASSHESGIRGLLLTLFSKANDTYRGSEGATEKAVAIVNPNLSIFGVSTPEDLWSQFSSGNADDGFLPRWLVFATSEARQRARTPAIDITDCPEHLRKKLHAMLDVRPAGNLNGITTVKPIRAAWGDGAQAFFEGLQDEMDDRGDAAKEDRRFTEQKVSTRFAEHVIKLALIYAVGIDPSRPVITCAALEWACAIVGASSVALVEAIEGKVADSERQAEYLWVLNRVQDAGPDGILDSVLIRDIRGKFDKRRYDDIIGQLMAGGEIWRDVKAPAGGGRPGLRVGALALEREAG